MYAVRGNNGFAACDSATGFVVVKDQPVTIEFTCERLRRAFHDRVIAIEDVELVVMTMAGPRRFCRPRAALGGAQRPGDCNQDGVRDISDAVCLLGFLFLGSPRELPCTLQGSLDPGMGNLRLVDFDGSEGLDISDAVFFLQYLFRGGASLAGCLTPSCSECLPILDCPQRCGV